MPGRGEVWPRLQVTMICQSTTTATAARLCKLYGTEARKGDSVPDRPHRGAKILDEPERLQAVPIEALEALASEASGGASRTKAELPQSMFSSCCSCLTFPVSTRAASCRLTESSQHIIGNRQPALGSKAARGRVVKREAGCCVPLRVATLQEWRLFRTGPRFVKADWWSYCRVYPPPEL